MFEFPEVVTDLSTVPEQFRTLYHQPDKAANEHKLITDNPIVRGAVEAVTGLNKALKAARADAETARKSKVDLTPLKAFGEDPSTIAQTVQQKLKEYEDQLAKGGQTKIDLEKVRADMTASFTKEKQTLEARTKGLQNQLHSILVENNAKSAIAALKGEIDLLMPFVKEWVEVVEEDGQVKVLVVNPEDRSRRFNGLGKDMSIGELVAEMKTQKKFARLFESDAPKGGGTPASGQGSKSSQGDGELTSNQKISAGLKAGNYGRGDSN